MSSGAEPRYSGGMNEKTVLDTESEILEQVIVRTDGVPLFVEELTKNVL